jgi:hypothetical protein
MYGWRSFSRYFRGLDCFSVKKRLALINPNERPEQGRQLKKNFYYD